MHVLLVNPTVRFRAVSKVTWDQLEVAKPIQAGPSYGLLSIAAVLREGGHTVENLDPNVFESWDDFVREFDHRLFHTDALGVCSYSPSVTSDEQNIRHAREVRPNLLILLGGYFPSLRGDIALATTEADIIVCGEADLAVTEVLTRLDAFGARHPLNVHARDALEGITGVRLRYFERGIEHLTPDSGRALLTSAQLDRLPVPLWSISPLEHYRDIWGSRYIDFSTGRSCDRHCPFCSIVDIGKRGAVRAMTPEVVLDRLVESSAMIPDLEYVFFADAHFAYDRARTIEICSGIVDRKDRGLLPRSLAFGCETRVDTLFDDVLDAMQAAGFVQVWLGLESGAPDTLKQYRKGQTVDQGRQAVVAASKRGITVIGFLMVAGPESTVGDILATLELAIFLLEHGGDVTPDVSYCLISWEGTTQIKETRHKAWDFSYVLKEFVKYDPYTGDRISNLVAEGGYTFPEDYPTRLFIRTAYEYAMKFGSIHTSTFLAGLFLAANDLFVAFPHLRDEWSSTVERLYSRAQAVAKTRKVNVWGIPLKELSDLKLEFQDSSAIRVEMRM